VPIRGVDDYARCNCNSLHEYDGNGVSFAHGKHNRKPFDESSKFIADGLADCIPQCISNGVTNDFAHGTPKHKPLGESNFVAD
jgi:hypothetical protein|tara:strand:- start:117 stop:365 length:249 start_codon:yes stop_codon:yes gene_type:complete